MKVVPFDMGKTVAHGTCAAYERVAVVPVLAKLSDASLCGLFDLGVLATWKFSLISLDYVQKISIST
jgi:hypothetical protein